MILLAGCDPESAAFIQPDRQERVHMELLLTLATDPAAWAALVTLVVMEVVLGIDNLIFISILSNKLPVAQRARTQRIGIMLALVMRLVLLGTVAWIAQLTQPVF